ncbi:MAG: mevalonate kinase family protein [Hydrogenovibrio sp.]
MKETLCTTPAKLILTGEHAVLFGAPALSMAIELNTHAVVQYTPNDARGVQPVLEIALHNFNQKMVFPYLSWQKHVTHIESRYALFEKNALAIQTVLQQPVDLVLVTFQQFHNTYKLKPGHWSITLDSHPLTGRGLGSSASIIISLLHSLFVHHGLDVSEIELITLAQKIEARQHGTSSGVDPTTVYRGGLLRFQQGYPTQQLPHQSFSAWMIDTGKPGSTTGQAVNHVHQYFTHQSGIWQDFKQVASEMESAWKLSNAEQLNSAIQANQALLEQLGVVPDKVKAFVAALNNSTHYSAKVCGAGSVSGDSAGAVLCIGSEPPERLCERYGYDFYALKINDTGSQCEVHL